MNTDSRLDDLKRLFEFETDEELNRKRGVYLSFIVEQTKKEIEESRSDLDFNREAYRVLSEIVQAREKNKQYRDRQELWIKWVGLGVAFVAGVVVTGAAVWLKM